MEVKDDDLEMVREAREWASRAEETIATFDKRKPN